jgi:hypothetical protein
MPEFIAFDSLFALGSVVATPGAVETMKRLSIEPITLLLRHTSGDWGELCEQDREENIRSIEHGYRVFSSYLVDPDTKLYVITEADRSYTTILLPSEY